jgi:glycerophosphoryl diester phosphodiesterase
MLLGHRGACAERPENTMASFERAVELGVDVLETDVHMTRDGAIVVSHDASARRMTGVGRAFAEVTAAEVRRWDAGWGFVDARGERPFAGCGMTVPLLADLLEAFPRMPLNVDIKQRRPSMVDALLELIDAHDAAERITLASFHSDVIRAVRARGYRGPTVLAQAEVMALLVTPGVAARWLAPGDVVQIPTRVGRLNLATRRMVNRCHALGLRVDYWTVNDPVEAAALLDLGADGLISDDPAALRAIFDRARA